MGKKAAGPARPGEAGPGWAGGGPAAPGEAQGGGGRSRDAHGTGNRGERDRDRAGGGGRGAPGVWIGECLSGVGGLQRAPPMAAAFFPVGVPPGPGAPSRLGSAEPTRSLRPAVRTGEAGEPQPQPRPLHRPVTAPGPAARASTEAVP